MPASTPHGRYAHLASPPALGRPPKSTAAKVMSVVFSPTGVATTVALTLAFVAIRSTARADAAERLARDLIDEGRK
jgi:hypothetical protein